jgi:tetratricopeptide (TPR) repeat protein
VESLRIDVDLVRCLEEARLQASVWQASGYDYAGADQVYGEAFLAHGLDVSKLPPDEAAGRIRKSAIRTLLVAALDNWANTKDQLHADSGEPLRDIARLADDDEWRQQLRDRWLRRNRAALEGLAKDAVAMKQQPATLVLLGRALDETGGWATAVKLLRKAQQRHPADFWISFDLGNLLLKKPTMRAEAVGDFRAALALRPQNPAIHIQLARALCEQDKPAEAEGFCRTALDLKPDYAEAYGILGGALRDQGRRVEAEAALRIAIAHKPELAWLHYTLIFVLRDQGRLDEAEEACRTALKLKPDYAEVYGLLASNLWDRGKLAESAEAFRKAVAFHPHVDWLHYALGGALRDQGKLEEAEVAYRKAIELKPDYAEAFVYLGIVLRDQRKPAKAEEACRKAITFQPDSAVAHYHLGLALRDQGKSEEAQDAWRKAEGIWRKGLTLQPDPVGPMRPWVYYQIGNAVREQGKLVEAVEAYRQAIALRPGLAVPDLVEANDNLGIALRDLGKPAEAMAAFRKAIAIKPDYAAAHCNLGLMFARQGQFEIALAELQRGYELGIARFPTKSHLYLNALGMALYRAGRFEESIERLHEAMQAQAKGGDAWDFLFLAMAHQQLGQSDEARQWYDKAVAWLEQNQQSVEKNKTTQAELRRFRTEAAQLLGLD